MSTKTSADFESRVSKMFKDLKRPHWGFFKVLDWTVIKNIHNILVCNSSLWKIRFTKRWKVMQWSSTIDHQRILSYRRVLEGYFLHLNTIRIFHTVVFTMRYSNNMSVYLIFTKNGNCIKPTNFFGYCFKSQGLQLPFLKSMPVLTIELRYKTSY